MSVLGFVQLVIVGRARARVAARCAPGPPDGRALGSEDDGEVGAPIPLAWAAGGARGGPEASPGLQGGGRPKAHLTGAPGGGRPRAA